MNSGLNIENDERLALIRSQLRDLNSLLRYERALWLDSCRARSGAASERDDFLALNDSQPGFRQVVSARAILRSIDLNDEPTLSEASCARVASVLGKHDILKHDLLYFIAATDDRENLFGHSQLVAAYAVLLAKAVGITSRERLTDLERGAMLHDIGKIAIPDSILQKPGALTPLEREIIKEHPLVGFEIVREFDFLQGAAEVVLYHHERFDGRGYPFGLSGRQIPLEARIFSIADTIDAMTTDRAYRKRTSFEEAFDEVDTAAGSQFDPELASVVQSIPAEQWLWIKRNVTSRLNPSITH